MANFDIILYGASGFTGRLVAEYLFRHAPKGLSWAVAGRNRSKLKAMLVELGANVPILEANNSDPASLRAMAVQTKVVCTTVGPYAKFGLPLVQACAQAGTDYCDLTGEVHFIHQAIVQCEARAIETGARIVHACGFDSIPSDLGTLLLALHFESRGKKLAAVRLRVERARGGVSGGTVASMFGVLEAAKDPQIRRLLLDPYALLSAGSARGSDMNEHFVASKDGDLGEWTAPFLMAAINTRVVRRSAATLNYGQHFSYEERMNTGKGLGGMLAATALCWGLGGIMATASLPGFKSLYRSAFASPGAGPSRNQRAAGSFSMLLHAVSVDGERALARVNGNQDPGYAETSKMLAESAICLALDSLPSSGGILTPAVALGLPLVKRLRAAAMTFEVTSL